MQSALIIPDTHIPYESRNYNLALEVGAFEKISQVVILGDYADFYTVSAHPKELGRNVPQLLEREVACVNKRLDEIDKVFGPRVQKIFIEGNHEYRLARYLRDRCPELFGYVDCVQVFNLKCRPNWKWVPYGPDQKFRILKSKLYARHEPIGPTAKTTAQRAMVSCVYGHVHKLEMANVVGMDNSQHTAFCPGWLGNKNASVMKYVKNHAQWAEGFAIVHTEGSLFFPEIIPIIKNKAYYKGKVFK
jgi:predicted phosphodiesterase